MKLTGKKNWSQSCVADKAMRAFWTVEQQKPLYRLFSMESCHPDVCNLLICSHGCSLIDNNAFFFFFPLALATLLWLWALALKVMSATRCVWESRKRCRRRTSSTCSSCSRHCPQSSRCCKGKRGRQRKASYSFMCSLLFHEKTNPKRAEEELLQPGLVWWECGEPRGAEMKSFWSG